MAVLGVLVGAWWSDASLRTAPVWWAAAAAAMLAIAAYAWNDAGDIAIDLLAHPGRPLPSGRIRVHQVHAAARAAALLGIAASALASAWLAPVSGAVLVLFYFYSPVLKRWGLAGNITVAVLASLPFVYGAVAAGRLGPGLELAAVAAPLHLAREFAKDIDDAPADAIARRTLPLRIGAGPVRLAIAASAGTFLILANVLLGPAVRPGASGWLLLPAAITLGAAAAAWRGASGAPALFKAAMLVALASLLAARR